MEFLPLSRRRSSARNVSSGVERGKTAVFAGYPFTFQKLFVNCNNPCSNGSRLCGLDWLESRRVVPVFKFVIFVKTTRARLACVAGASKWGWGGREKRSGIGERGEGTFPFPFSLPFSLLSRFSPSPLPLPFLRLPRRQGPGRRQLRFPSFPVKGFFGKDKTHFLRSNIFKWSSSLKMTLKLKGQS